MSTSAPIDIHRSGGPALPARPPYYRHNHSDDSTTPSTASTMTATYNRKHSYSLDSTKSSDYSHSRYSTSTAPTVDTMYTTPPSSAVSYTHTSKPLSSRPRPPIPGAISSRARTFSEDLSSSASNTRDWDWETPRPKEKHHHHLPLPTKAAKAKIKPLLKLAKPHRSSTSLDLSLPGGGSAGLHLGLHSNSDSEDYEDGERFGRHSLQLGGHRRNWSGASLTGRDLHPMRQVPRGYGSVGGSAGGSVSSFEVDGVERMRHSLERARPPVPTALRIRTDSNVTPPSSVGSPISPLSASTTVPTPYAFHAPAALTTPTSATSTITQRPPQSPSYEASLNAARLAWDLKEQKYAEKLEKKRRKSEQKERERELRKSMDEGRRRGSSEGSCGERCSPNSHEPLCASRQGARSSSALPIAKIFKSHTSSPRSSTPVLQPTALQGSSTHLPQPPSISAASPSNEPTFIGGIALKSTSLAPRRKSEQGLKARWMSFVIWVRTKMWRLRRKVRRVGSIGRRNSKTETEKVEVKAKGKGGLFRRNKAVVVV